MGGGGGEKCIAEGGSQLENKGEHGGGAVDWRVAQRERSGKQLLGRRRNALQREAVNLRTRVRRGFRARANGSRRGRGRVGRRAVEGGGGGGQESIAEGGSYSDGKGRGGGVLRSCAEQNERWEEGGQGEEGGDCTGVGSNALQKKAANLRTRVRRGVGGRLLMSWLRTTGRGGGVKEWGIVVVGGGEGCIAEGSS